jgi:hypothetical protein
MPDGRMMLQQAADPYIENGYHVTFVVVRDHSEKYESEYAIRKAYGDTVDVVVLDDFTSGPAETIYHVIKDWNDTTFAVNDCDSFFDFTPIEENYVVYADLNNYPLVNGIHAKSFIIKDETRITDIIEKKISSGFICIGGYGFKSSSDFIKSYTQIKDNASNEIFLSHVIKQMMLNGENVVAIEGSNYIDCGTYESYVENMKNHMAIFCDIDGIIFKNQSRYFKNSHSNEPTINPSAIQFLKERIALGATVIFTTARKEDTRDVTETAIRKAGIDNFRIIYDLPHAPRLLINDVHYSNPWPAASAINAPRNDDDFWRMFS